jgi:hypothetical protein
MNPLPLTSFQLERESHYSKLHQIHAASSDYSPAKLLPLSVKHNVAGKYNAKTQASNHIERRRIEEENRRLYAALHKISLLPQNDFLNAEHQKSRGEIMNKSSLHYSEIRRNHANYTNERNKQIHERLQRVHPSIPVHSYEREYSRRHNHFHRSKIMDRMFKFRLQNPPQTVKHIQQLQTQLAEDSAKRDGRHQNLAAELMRVRELLVKDRNNSQLIQEKEQLKQAISQQQQHENFLEKQQQLFFFYCQQFCNDYVGTITQQFSENSANGPNQGAFGPDHARIGSNSSGAGLIYSTTITAADGSYISPIYSANGGLNDSQLLISPAELADETDNLDVQSSSSASPRRFQVDLTVVKEEPDLEVSKIVSSLKQPINPWSEWEQLQQEDYSNISLDPNFLGGSGVGSPFGSAPMSPMQAPRFKLDLSALELYDQDHNNYKTQSAVAAQRKLDRKQQLIRQEEARNKKNKARQIKRLQLLRQFERNNYKIVKPQANPGQNGRNSAENEEKSMMEGEDELNEIDPLTTNLSLYELKCIFMALKLKQIETEEKRPQNNTSSPEAAEGLNNGNKSTPRSNTNEVREGGAINPSNSYKSGNNAGNNGGSGDKKSLKHLRRSSSFSTSKPVRLLMNTQSTPALLNDKPVSKARLIPLNAKINANKQ